MPFSASAFKGRGNTVKIRSNSHCRELMDKSSLMRRILFQTRQSERGRRRRSYLLRADQVEALTQYEAKLCHQKSRNACRAVPRY